MANALAWVSGGLGYILQQDFEQAGTPPGWTGSAGATFHNTVSPLEGTGDLKLLVGNATGTFDSTPTESWSICLIKFVTLPGVSSEVNSFMLRDSGNGNRSHFNVTQTGVIKVFNNGIFVGSPVNAVTTGTLYYFKMHYKTGTGSNSITEVEFSTTGTWIGSGNGFFGITNGTSQNNVVKLVLNSPDTAEETRLDHIRVSTTDLGSNFSSWT